ncbi:hypothetical protein D3C73_985400 [compost metagenome]
MDSGLLPDEALRKISPLFCDTQYVLPWMADNVNLGSSVSMMLPLLLSVQVLPPNILTEETRGTYTLPLRILGALAIVAVESFIFTILDLAVKITSLPGRTSLAVAVF